MTARSAVLAGTSYVSTDVKADGDGSKDRPFASVEAVLEKVGGGHTIIVKPGVYRGPIQIAKRFAGTKAAPTVIKSEVKWKAIIIGAPYHVISNDDDCHWVTVDGFKVQGARYDGIKMNGDHNVVRNCWVHNNQAMGVAMHNKRGGVIENNLIEFNGSHVQYDHGVYADGEGLVICGNVVRHNASYGLHLYPSIKNSVIANNVVHGQVRRRGIIVACPKGGGRNRIVNNTVADDQPLTIWNGDGEVVANNILVARDDEALALGEQTQNTLVDYNLCLPKSDRNDSHGVTGDPMFVDANKGLFWLRPESPARGKGSLEHAPDTDFWGRARPKDRPPDLGALPFVPELARPEARQRFENGWAYFRHGSGGTMPDFWTLTSSEPGKAPR
ncbi:MAG: right-handed parallel beta-helix repeat-containing protein [Verrucomicrobia bacterium]|nr:right-handed parallel beta-helix repeat-containing protein [Verrucomicrobiota bacterium]